MRVLNTVLLSIWGEGAGGRGEEGERTGKRG